MLRAFISVLLIAAMMPVSARAVAAPAAPAHAAEVVQPKRSLPASPELTYYVALLYRGDKAESIPADSANAIQADHMDYTLSLTDEKKVALSGPFTDDTALREIVVFRGGTMEEVKQLCGSDPAIRAGLLRAEIHSWHGPRGIRTAYDDRYKIKLDNDTR